MPRLLTICIWLLYLTACAQPQWQAHATAAQTPQLSGDYAVMADGYRLPLAVTPAHGSARAIVLALHGFNDYRNAFRDPADYLADHGLLTVAYDQRGFGATAQRGHWPGSTLLAEDATAMADLLCSRYPGLPLFLLGESMGGAVLIESLRTHVPGCLAGVILAAPAVWGWSAMPWWQTLILRVATHVVPGHTVTGKGLHITPSDNIEMLRALGRDPLVIKATRIDTIYGLTDLMEAASRHGADLPAPVLLLYGEHDEIIPHGALCDMLDHVQITPPGGWSMALYPQGYHMLTRDLQAEVVLRDVVAWTLDPAQELPSGQRISQGSKRLQGLCQEQRLYSAG